MKIFMGLSRLGGRMTVVAEGIGVTGLVSSPTPGTLMVTRRPARATDTRRRAGRDDVAGQQRHDRLM